MLPFSSVKHPTYRLDQIKGLIKDDSWYITGSALDTAGELGFDKDDIYDCIVNCLSETHFYKTMRSEKRAGTMHDVYHITYQDVRIYLKLQVCVDAVVISFKAQ
jgi:hypothetical protein